MHHDAEHVSVVYAKAMASLKHGHALWVPEGTDDSQEIEIGDVGYVNDTGFFMLLFNVDEAYKGTSRGMETKIASEECQYFKFKALCKPQSKKHFLAPDIYTSNCRKKVEAEGGVAMNINEIVAKIEFGHSNRSQQVAFCYLPEHGAYTWLETNDELRDYVANNIELWHRHSPPSVKLDSIMVVYGTIKSPQYGIGAASSMQKSRRIEGKVNATVLEASSRYSDTSALDIGIQKRSVLAGEPAPSGVPEQRMPTIFFNCYRMKFNRWRWRYQLKGAAGPHTLPGPDDPEHSAAVLVEDSDDETAGTTAYQPVDALLDYILSECPQAESAIACDGDVHSLYLGEELPEDILESLHEKHPAVVVNGNNVASLDLQDVVRRERVHKITGSIPDAVVIPDGEANVPGEFPIREAQVLFGGDGNARSTKWPHLCLSDKAQQLGSLICSAVSSDGKRMAIAFDDASICLWNLVSGKLIRVLEGHEDTPYSLSFSPDGMQLASGSSDTRVLVWTLPEYGDEGAMADGTTGYLEVKGHSFDITKVVYSPDGTRLTSGSLDGQIVVWDATHNYDKLFVISNGDTTSMSICFTPDGTKLIATKDNIANIRDMTDRGAELFSMVGHTSTVWSLVMSHDGSRVATASDDCTARVWDVNSGNELLTLHEHNNSVWCVTFSPDDGEIATGSRDSTIVISDSWTGDRRHVLQNAGLVNTIEYSPSGSLMCSGNMEGTVKLWNPLSGTLIAEYQGHMDKIKSIAFSPDGEDIVSSSEDGTIRKFSVTDVLRLLPS